MFQQVFSLILVLLVVSFATEVTTPLVALSPALAILILLGGYAAALALIVLQCRLLRLRLDRMGLLVNAELVIFFAYVFLIVASQLYFPLFLRSTTFFSLLVLLLYFFALALFRHAYEPIKEAKKEKAWGQVFFLVPFLLPYFTLTTLVDLGLFLFGTVSDAAVTFLIAAILIISLLFLPYVLQIFWQCTPLPSAALKRRLQTLCDSACFRYKEMQVWTVMGSTLTAAIVGILPQFRYIMFTPNLLRMLNPEHIEAVLAHEIGHSKRHHLIYYPFIIMGMIVAVGLAYKAAAPWIPIALPLFYLFVPYVLIIWLYYRFIFGYFSRLFERQADLYGFELGLPAEAMIGALDHIAIAAGNIHHIPSWHHFGISQRIQFLEKAAADPSLIARHHRKVKISLTLYFCLLILGIFTLIWY